MLPAAWKRPESSASLSQSVRGAIAASSLRRSSDSDTFELQEPPLVLRSETAVRTEAGCRNDTVARQDERKAIVRAERSRCTLCVRVTRRARKLAVGHDLAVGNV